MDYGLEGTRTLNNLTVCWPHNDGGNTISNLWLLLFSHNGINTHDPMKTMPSIWLILKQFGICMALGHTLWTHFMATLDMYNPLIN